MTRPLLAALAGASIFFAFGCDAKPKSDSPAGPDGKPVAGLKELNKIDVKVGEGPDLKKGDLVFIIYTGKLKNGTVFDSNDKPDANPFAHLLGGGGVISGWEEGIPGMKVGGQRTLEIPSRLAYGAGEAPGGKIPPNSDLYFDIKVVDAVRAGEENYFDKKDLKVGTGPTASVGDTVTIHYVGKLANGRRFDSTYERKKPESFKIGAVQVIKGLDAGVVGMKEGGKRWLRIPPNIGYGVYGLNMVPGGQVVIFEVELLKVKKG